MGGKRLYSTTARIEAELLDKHKVTYVEVYVSIQHLPVVKEASKGKKIKVFQVYEGQAASLLFRFSASWRILAAPMADIRLCVYTSIYISSLIDGNPRAVTLFAFVVPHTYDSLHKKFSRGGNTKLLEMPEICPYILRF